MPSLKPGTNVEADTSISKGASFIQTHTEEQEVEVSMAASRWCWWEIMSWGHRPDVAATHDDFPSSVPLRAAGSEEGKDSVFRKAEADSSQAHSAHFMCNPPALWPFVRTVQAS